MLRLICAVLLPIVTLSSVFLVGVFVTNSISASLGNAIEVCIGILLFWPLAVLERLLPLSGNAVEGFWNDAMAPCAKMIVPFYIFAAYLSLGRVRFFSNSIQGEPSNYSKETLTCTACGKTFSVEGFAGGRCPSCQGRL